MRKTPMKPRREPMKRTRLRPKKRSAKETERIYGTDAHQDWLRDQPCVGCGRMGSEDWPHHLHHTKNGGKGRKANATDQVPLCAQCHDDFHRYGPETFEAWHPRLRGFTLREWAGGYASAWITFGAAYTIMTAKRQKGLVSVGAIVPGVVADVLARLTEDAG